MRFTEQEYYSSEGAWGSYQYISLEEIVNNYIMSLDSDDWTSLVPRYKILYQARKGIRQLYFDVAQEIKAIELDLSPNLNIILPPDFVNYVRVSWVDDNGMLHPMAVDKRMTIAQQYLQDSEFELLFDANGCVLKDSGEEEYFVKDGTDNDDSEARREYQPCSRYSFCDYEPNRDFSRNFPNGSFRLDKNSGIIQFNSNAKGKKIVLEYISDGMHLCNDESVKGIRIHKFAEEALLSYIFFQLIKNRRSVHAVEKQRAKKEYYNNKRLAKRRINTLRKPELLQIFKGASKVIK